MRYWILLPLLALLPRLSYACSCYLDPTITFEERLCGMADDTTGLSTLVRARVDRLVRDRRHPRVELTILERFQGDFDGQRVALLGGDGGNCNSYTGVLARGEEIYVSFWAGGFISYYSDNIATDLPVFDFGVCGYSHVVVSDGRLRAPSGLILENSRERGLLDRLNECGVGKPVSILPGLPARRQLTVYPNPTTGGITLTFDDPEARLRSAALYTLTGQRMDIPALSSITEPLGTLSLNLRQAGAPRIAPGVYVLVAETDRNRVRQRLVIH